MMRLPDPDHIIVWAFAFAIAIFFISFAVWMSLHMFKVV